MNSDKLILRFNFLGANNVIEMLNLKRRNNKKKKKIILYLNLSIL
jgi:3-deoxy-D-manno-octulosonic-acid transferase